MYKITSFSFLSQKYIIFLSIKKTFYLGKGKGFLVENTTKGTMPKTPP